MNIAEGTRRLGLLLGCLGCLVVVVASSTEWETIWSSRARHKRLESLSVGFGIPAKRFKVGEARSAGYSDSEILHNFAEMQKANIEGAKKSGYTDAEILELLEFGVPPAPRMRDCFSLVLLAAMGFLIPWGVLRSIGWVLEGFKARSPTRE